ncbi:MAG TPA: aspartate--tRNA ligase [Thermoanaerobaculia bacterium]|nr:aspartate--tRNA ligase [Thermoanaerobaculia bacterium]
MAGTDGGHSAAAEPVQLARTGAGTLRAGDVGRRVRLAAWVQRRRDLGGLQFFDLRDRSGVAQVVVRPDEDPEIAAALEAVRAEWVVEVEGEVVERESPNAEMATGAVEVIARRAVVLNRAEPVPFALSGETDASEETRLAYRYLDLRRHDLQKNFLLRDRVTLEIRRYFHEQGFVDVETPILTLSTPEGARDYLVPSRVHPGSFYALPQSPQIFKQLLMVAGLERYVQIARCFRDEDLRADRQPEFTQIDVEMSFNTEEDVYAVIEGLLRRIMPLAGIEVPERLPRLTWAEAMLRYGSDRPDRRFGSEIVDLSQALGGSGFRGFAQAVAEGGVVRGFAVPGAAGASRRQVDEWAELARRHGAAGVLTLRRTGGELAFQVKNALAAGEADAAAEALGLEEGGLALLAAGPAATTAAALGALRLALAREYGLISQGDHAFCWVTEFPLFERDEAAADGGAAGRWYSVNHPFTAPDPRDLERLDSEPGSVRARAYDVVMDGLELGGGSIRIHDAALQERVFRILGIGPEEARRRFGFLLEALAFGAPPHGGIALGLDRIVMSMAGAASLRDVIAFPKTTRASDLMTSAPAPVEEAQLADLQLTVRRPEGDGA